MSDRFAVESVAMISWLRWGTKFGGSPRVYVILWYGGLGVCGGSGNFPEGSKVTWH